MNRMPAIRGGPKLSEPPPTPTNAVDPTGKYRSGDQGAIPLIAHLVWPDREEWRAVTARQWTRHRVWVTWPPTRNEPGGNCWLDARDVTRVVVRPPGEG